MYFKMVPFLLLLLEVPGDCSPMFYCENLVLLLEEKLTTGGKWGMTEGPRSF